MQFGSLRSTNALDPLEIRTSHVRSICHESLNKRPVNPAAVLKIFQVLLEVRFFYGKVHEMPRMVGGGVGWKGQR